MKSRPFAYDAQWWRSWVLRILVVSVTVSYVNSQNRRTDRTTGTASPASSFSFDTGSATSSVPSTEPVVTRLNCFTRPDSKMSMVCRQWRDSNRPELQKVVVNAARDSTGRLVPGVPVELTIQDCRVSEIPSRFLTSDALESLTVSGCLAGSQATPSISGVQKTEINAEAFAELTSLRRLDLSGNRLRKLPETIGYIRTLKELNLENNLLSSWGLKGGSGRNPGVTSAAGGAGSWELDTDDWFANITVINLGFNRLGVGAVVVGPRPSKDDILGGLESTPISPMIPTTAFTMGNGAKKSLQALSLRSNGFTAFPEDFLTSFATLRDLDLSFNQISSIPRAAFARMPELRSLKLDHNSLRTFHLVELPPSTTLISLEGNPLRCDCHARWLRDLLNEEETTFVTTASSTSSSSGPRLPSGRSFKSSSFGNETSSTAATTESSDGDTNRVTDTNPASSTPPSSNAGTTNQRFNLGQRRSTTLAPFTTRRRSSRQLRATTSSRSSNRRSQDLIRKRNLTVKIPSCQTPLLYRNWPLDRVSDAMLCPDQTTKKSTKSFFYVGNGDKNLFGADVLDAVNIIRAEQLDANSALLSWKVDPLFLTSGFDWSIVYRRVGDKMNIFHETSLNKRGTSSNSTKNGTASSPSAQFNVGSDKVRNSSNGTIGNDGTFHNMLSGLDEDTFYVVCVAVVESNNYYIHLSKCVEVKTAQVVTTTASTTPAASSTVTAPPSIQAEQSIAVAKEPSRLRRLDYYPESISFQLGSDAIGVKWKLSRSRSKLVVAPKNRGNPKPKPSSSASGSPQRTTPAYHSSIVHRVPLDGGKPSSVITAKSGPTNLVRKNRQKRNTGGSTGASGTEEEEDPVWRISYRRFGSQEEDRVLILKNTENYKNRTLEYSIENLEPTTGYIVCFEALPYDEALDSDAPGATFGAIRKTPSSTSTDTEHTGGEPICRELLTLETNAFPVTEVAVATTVSSSATVVVVVLMCCVCPGCLSMKDKKKKNQTNGCCHANDNSSNSSADNTDSSRLNSTSSSTTNALPVGRKNYVYNVGGVTTPTDLHQQQRQQQTGNQLHSILNPGYECTFPSLTTATRNVNSSHSQNLMIEDGATTTTTAGSGYLSPRTTLNRPRPVTSMGTISDNRPGFSDFHVYYNQPRLPPVPTATAPPDNDASWSSTDESSWSQFNADRQLVDIPRATLRSRTPNNNHRRRRGGSHYNQPVGPARKALSVGDLTLRSQSTLDFRSMVNLTNTADWFGDAHAATGARSRTGPRNHHQQRNSPVKRRIMGKSGNTLSGVPSMMQPATGQQNDGYLSLPSLLHESPTSGSDDNHHPQDMRSHSVVQPHTSYKKHSTLQSAKRLHHQHQPSTSTGRRSNNTRYPELSDGRMNLYHTWTIPTMQEQLRQLDRSLEDGLRDAPSSATQYRQRLFQVDM